jgi:hypothetical protein
VFYYTFTVPTLRRKSPYGSRYNRPAEGEILPQMHARYFQINLTLQARLSNYRCIFSETTTYVALLKFQWASPCFSSLSTVAVCGTDQLMLDVAFDVAMERVLTETFRSVL